MSAAVQRPLLANEQSSLPVGVLPTIGGNTIPNTTPPVAREVGPIVNKANFDDLFRKAHRTAYYSSLNDSKDDKHTRDLHHIGIRSHEFRGDGAPLLPHENHQLKGNIEVADLKKLHKDTQTYIKRDIEKLIPAKLSDIAEPPKKKVKGSKPPIKEEVAMEDYVRKPGYEHLPKDVRHARQQYDAGIKNGPKVIGGANTEHRIKEFLGKNALSAKRVDFLITDVPDHLKETGGFPRRVQGYSVMKKLKHYNELRDMQRVGKSRTVKALFNDPLPISIYKHGRTSKQIDHEKEIRLAMLHARKLAARHSDVRLKNLDIVNRGGMEQKDAPKNQEGPQMPSGPATNIQGTVPSVGTVPVTHGVNVGGQSTHSSTNVALNTQAPATNSGYGSNVQYP